MSEEPFCIKLIASFVFPLILFLFDRFEKHLIKIKKENKIKFQLVKLIFT
ncbi:MAG: hypothetical protein ACI94Y_001884 [Maribacter sp.]|jgi:hypothetical protein